MANEKIIVQLASPERKYVKVYHDFLDNSFLSVEEQMIFIVLKSYIDFREDSGEAFPSVKTLCKRAKMSKPRTIKAINNLVKKGIAKKIQRGLTKTNVYTLSDYPAMWACDNVEDMAAVADNKGIKPLTPAEHITELERMGYTVQIKEKGLETEPTKAQYQAPQTNNIDIDKDSTEGAKSQSLERYTIGQIQQLFEYDAMLQEYPEQQQDIDVVMNILYNAMNTDKTSIRVSGQDKPSMAVIGKLMKLDRASIIYAIGKYQEQTGKINNPSNYMLTMLYNAPEQRYLDMQNQSNNKAAGAEHRQADRKTDGQDKHPQNNFANFEQRTYDFEKLEKRLLGQTD